ncbi:hypothetical protein DSW25_11860 [Sulfitobacter donghicola DSW-25 = KCTC 12864 = JCM 14565]|uniref:DUF2061 domain-containing protein n=1 Tax=Sulfitobacter donghicola DSW-25 = KCTC 12864 = JCM 14565 TaxID=1300350 RepID=A0A073IGK8_9RHOB|nr:hypothetical protein DSW25_11860 [Sulfitobacter donghicola DSW-25 = KCTC 12864 = JCM 14565]
MDSTIRTATKALTWQLMGLVTMTAIGFVFTGSIAAGGGIAIVGAAAGFVSYFFHERVWQKVSWGRVPNNATTGLSNSN